MTSKKRMFPDAVQDERQRGWSWFDNGVIREYGPKIGSYGVAVYMALVSFADNQTQTCYPSFQTLATMLNMSRRMVMLTAEKLREAGLIKIQKRYKAGKEPTANLYTILQVKASESHALPSECGAPASEQDALPSEYHALLASESHALPSECGAPELYSVNQTHSSELYSVNQTHELDSKTPLSPPEGEEHVRTSAKPSRKPKSAKSNALIDYTPYPGFLRLWAIAVPRQGNKGSKKEALTAWLALQPTPEEDLVVQNQIITAYATLKKTPAWQNENGKYVKELHRWIEKQCWEGVEVEPEADADARLIAFVQQREAEEAQLEEAHERR